MLILASSSPRRQHLLTILGLTFHVRSADIDEGALSLEAPESHARRLAQTKAQLVARSAGPEDVILAADTIVVHQGRILGKPPTDLAAKRMLKELQGVSHHVITAVALMQAGSLTVRSHTSEVLMRAYTDAEIEAYVATGDPLDKAGAYAIQNTAFHPVLAYSGCYASIMGLPLYIVADLFRSAGLYPDPGWIQSCHRYAGNCCQAALRSAPD